MCSQPKLPEEVSLFCYNKREFYTLHMDLLPQRNSCKRPQTRPNISPRLYCKYVCLHIFYLCFANQKDNSSFFTLHQVGHKLDDRRSVCIASWVCLFSAKVALVIWQPARVHTNIMKGIQMTDIGCLLCDSSYDQSPSQRNK